MKGLITLAIFGLACATMAPGATANSFVQAVHTQLMLNGSPFRFSGANCYVLMGSPQATVDQFLATAQSNHFNVIRMRSQTEIETPSSSETFYTQYWDGTTPAFNDSTMTGLDHVDYAIYKAGQLGIKLIIPFVDNWSNLGGMDQYVMWNGGKYHDQFYTDPTIRQWYKNWISHLLNHVNTLSGIAYKDDPTIMVWELANESQCTGTNLPSSGTCTTATINSWIEDIAAYVKTVDSNHLVSVGDMGYFCTPSSPNYFENCSTGVDTLAFAQTANVDVFGFHVYPEGLGQTVAWADTFIDQHFADATSVVGKPVYIGEFGLLDRNTRNSVYKDWTDRILNERASGGLFWDLMPGTPSPVETELPAPDGFDIAGNSPIFQTIGNLELMLAANKVLPLAPVAGSQWQTTPFGQPVTFTPLDNDVAYAGATVDPTTIDLDPNTPGQQTSMVVYGGTFTVAGQNVQFTPAPGFNGQTQVSYTVIDSNHNLSNAAYLFVTVSASPNAQWTLESFEFGTDGWGPVSPAAGTISQSSTFHTSGASGLQVNVTAGGWFGADFPSASDLTGRPALAIDVQTTGAGGGSAIAFRSGAANTWCQNANFVTLSANGVTTVTVTLDQAQLTCFGGTPDFTNVTSVYVALTGPGTYYLDNLRALTSSGFVCTNTAVPSITSIDSASAYGGYPYFASGSWLEIKGTNLADPTDPRLTAATNPGQWTAADFNGSNAPTALDGISVSINGKPAYIWYLSPGQINVQAPEDTATGNVSVTVTNCMAASAAFTFARRALAPGFLAPANYTAGGTEYMVATFASDGAYVLNTATGAAFGLNSRPAKPGDLIVAYGIGFGDVTPSILPGVIVGAGNALVNPITLSFGSTPATLTYSGLAGSFVGLYEFYITVPNVANGDYQINVTQNGTAVPQTMSLTVHN